LLLPTSRRCCHAMAAPSLLRLAAFQLPVIMLLLQQSGGVRSLTVGCVGDSITQGVGASCPV
jgi:hypothetical protein